MIPTIDEVYAAQSRLRGIAIRTPLLKLNFVVPGIEIRGSANAIQILSKEDKRNGLVTPSVVIWPKEWPGWLEGKISVVMC